MKKQMLLASWTIFALIFSTVQAQDAHQNNQFRDTIILTPDANTKVLFIGGRLNDMVKYSKLDSLKMLLIEDVALAQKQPSYPSAPKVTHYFISSEGKRRLKTEGEDFLEPEVNVEKERQSLDLNLPKYVFIIHDLATNYECYIYLKDPQQLKNLSNESFNDALSSFVAKKKFRKTRFRVDLEKKNDQWKIENSFRNRQNFVEINPSLGIGLIGSQWSPELGFDINFVMSNRYGKPALKFGFNLSTYATGALQNDFSSLSYLSSFSFKILRNLSRRQADSKEKWAGLQYGWISVGTLAQQGYKVGFVTEGFGIFNYSFDLNIIKTGDPKAPFGQQNLYYSNPFYSVTLMFPF